MSKKDSQFSKYINKNVNLITVLGIFNGLAIYSSTLGDTNAAYVVGFVFTLLSVLIIRDLIFKIPKSKGLNFPLLSFVIGISLVWVFLIYLLFKKYTSASSMTAFLLLAFSTMFAIFKIIEKKLLNRIKKSHRNLHAILTLILIFIVFSLVVYFWSSIFDFCDEIFTTPKPKKIVY